MVEIERKFLLEEVPGWLGEHRSKRIEQGYVALTDDLEVRLRRLEGRQSLLTVKRGHGRSREEAEVELDGEAFEELWPLTEGRQVSKRRYLADRPEGEFEIDVYEGELEGGVVAEIEFADESAADSFEPPGWIGPEVTGDERFENRALATHGWPR